MKRLKSLLIVDDHQIVFSGIQLLLHAFDKQLEMQYCQTAEGCIAVLENEIFDVIVLDVNLPDTNTFKLVADVLKINPEQKILIYSMSSEAMYRDKFIELGAFGFVSKQATNEEFIKALETVFSGDVYSSSSNIHNPESTLSQVSSNDSSEIQKGVKSRPKVQEKIKSTFYVKSNGAYRLINLKDVQYFKVDGKHVKIYCGNEIFSLRTSLSNLEKRIENGFIRVHGTILVNEKQIFSFEPKEKKVYLKNGTIIPFSRHFKKNLVEKIRLVRSYAG